MFTITKNPMFNSLEITFTEKPSEKIRNVLKANKFRWHSVKSACSMALRMVSSSAKPLSKQRTKSPKSKSPLTAYKSVTCSCVRGAMNRPTLTLFKWLLCVANLPSVFALYSPPLQKRPIKDL